MTDMDLKKQVNYHAEMSLLSAFIPPKRIKSTEFPPTKCKGDSCGKISILAHPYCIACWKKEGLEVRTSQYGLGLFACRDMPKNHRIPGIYGSFRVGVELFNDSRRTFGSVYALQVEDVVITANTSRGGILRYINDYRNTGYTENLSLVNCEGEIHGILKSSVKAGEQLLAFYGNKFEL